MNHEPRKIFFKRNRIFWTNSQGEPEIEYVEYLESNNKEMLEALIETTMKMEEESIAHHWDKICPARSRMINNIIVIEKHMGKTWEELNESEPKRN